MSSRSGLHFLWEPFVVVPPVLYRRKLLAPVQAALHFGFPASLLGFHHLDTAGLTRQPGRALLASSASSAAPRGCR